MPESPDSAQLRRTNVDPQCPLYVDFSRPVCANSGHSQTVRRTCQVDPKLPFEIGPMNGREAPESGHRLNVSNALNASKFRTRFAFVISIP